MKSRITLVIFMILIPFAIMAKHELYERYDEDVTSLFNVLINYEEHGEVFDFILEHANITGQHLNIFKKIIHEKITSYKIIENHYLNGYGMYYIYVTTEKDAYGEYFWLQCCENSMVFIY